MTLMVALGVALPAGVGGSSPTGVVGRSPAAEGGSKGLGGHALEGGPRGRRWGHPPGPPLLHLGQAVEPGSRVLLVELLDLQRVLLEKALGPRLGAVVRDDAGALSREHGLRRLIGQPRREHKDLALLLHVLRLQAAAGAPLRRQGTPGRRHASQRRHVADQGLRQVSSAAERVAARVRFQVVVGPRVGKVAAHRERATCMVVVLVLLL
uniref:Putative secreted protein n=1 Tax=Ixodes ricinus TaxID=34613 RepID=A0A6B0V1N9_IXORI